MRRHFYICWFGLMFLGVGCSREKYKADADDEVYGIIDAKWQDRFGSKVNYRVSDVAPDPHDLTTKKTVPLGKLSLAQTVAMATAHNRAYQLQRENLYFTALDLTLERHQFVRQWYGTIDATYTKSGDEERVGSSGGVGFKQMLASGAQVSAGIALEWSRFLTGDPGTSLGSVLTASISQPLLRGRGRKVAMENLTQAERDMLYQIRLFNRYRKEFVVSVVNGYYRVLQRQQEMANAYNNYQSRIASRERLEMEGEAGRKAPFEVDQARQSELNARDNYIGAIQRYQQRLDEFKLLLALPTDADIQLDSKEIDALKLVSATGGGYSVEDAILVALEQRLDLANVADAVADAERKVMVAANDLQGDLNVFGSVGVNSGSGTNPNRLEFNQGNYQVGLEADLPFDRKAERNAYRRMLIQLEQRQRDHEAFQDQVKLAVRNTYRRFKEAQDRYETQKNSLELAETRVESTNYLLQAGRVSTRDLLDSQDALLHAQDSLIAALVDRAIAKLSFYRDIGLLQVKPDGMWEEVQKNLPRRIENAQIINMSSQNPLGYHSSHGLNNRAPRFWEEFHGKRQTQPNRSRKIGYK